MKSIPSCDLPNLAGFLSLLHWALLIQQKLLRGQTDFQNKTHANLKQLLKTLQHRTTWFSQIRLLWSRAMTQKCQYKKLTTSSVFHCAFLPANRYCSLSLTLEKKHTESHCVRDPGDSVEGEGHVRNAQTAPTIRTTHGLVAAPAVRQLDGKQENITQVKGIQATHPKASYLQPNGFC